MIYLDNAATTLIKPKSVIRAVNDCMMHYCANPGRSGHRISLRAAEVVYECREKVSNFFNLGDPNRVIFTSNATEALNIAIKGVINTNPNNCHVVISSMEHNSVIRPIVASGVSYSIAQADRYGFVSLDAVKQVTKSNTKLIVIIHASNVCGTLNPIAEIGNFARDRKILFLVDAAQTAGVVDIDMQRDKIDLLAMAGHKMLYGPSGTGVLCINKGVNLATFKEGGTGSRSESFIMPEELPDKFEAGTLNIAGIAGLSAGIDYIRGTTLDKIQDNELVLVDELINGISEIKGSKIYGRTNANIKSRINRVGVVGFNLTNKDSIYVTNTLNDRFDIASRGALHCAPLAHRTLGTIKTGVVRLSVSNFTTEKDIKKALDALKQISKN